MRSRPVVVGTSQRRAPAALRKMAATTATTGRNSLLASRGLCEGGREVGDGRLAPGGISPSLAAAPDALRARLGPTGASVATIISAGAQQLGRRPCRRAQRG